MKPLSYVIAIIAGTLLPIAFAPYGLFPLAIISPLILLFIFHKQTPKQAFWHGFSYGLGMFGVGVSWVFVSIYYYGNPNFFVAVPITALFVMVLALFPAFNGFLLNRFFPNENLSRLVIAFPASWALIEWIRSWIFSGFPWLLLGQSQTNSPLHGFAPIVGVYGVSFIIILSAGLLFTAITNQKRILSVSLLAIIWLSGFCSGFIQWTKPMSDAITVSLVQGNIPMSTKWSADMAISSLLDYQKLSGPYWKSQIIVWPETAITLLPNDAISYLENLDRIGNKNNTALITGIPIPVGAGDENYFYNSVILLGKGHGHYFKRHLVPFGEYVPLREIMGNFMQFFNFPMSDFVSGPREQELLKTANIKIAPYICYEIAFPSIVRTDLPAANLLVTLSNDSWFGKSYAMYQQRQIAQFAALSTGRYLLSSSNSGQTAIINSHGEVLATAPIDEKTTLEGSVYGMTGNTPWILIGDGPYLIMFSLLIIFVWRRHCKK
jgi:apolipoprotein N-acyltransferase